MKVVNLYDKSLDVIEKVVLREISRRTLNSDVDVIYKWKTMNGDIVNLHEITPSHLENLYFFIKNKITERDQLIYAFDWDYLG